MKKQFDKSLENNENFLKAICDKIGAAVILVDKKTDVIRYANNRVLIDLSAPHEQVVGKTYLEVFSPEFLQFYYNLVECTSHNVECTGIYYWSQKAFLEQVSVTSMQWEGRDSILITIINVNEVIRHDYDYEQVVFFDSVTGLPNERKLEEDIKALSDDEKITLLFVRVNTLDDIHDMYGWDVRDSLVISIRDWLMETKCRRTYLYRIGDIFIMLGRGITKDTLEKRVDEIRDRFAKAWTIPLEHGEFSIYCNVKIGFVYGEFAHDEIGSIVTRTLSMEEEGNLGYRVYDEATDEKVKRTHRLRGELIDCFHGGMRNFSVNYHPIIEVSTGNWVGAEALCRWESEEEGIVSPAEFVPLLEQMGMISHLDHWVRHNAMYDCASLGLGCKTFFLDVNFSPHQPVDNTFVESVFATAAAADFPLEQLIIEITESERMRFDERTLENLRLLKRNGVMLALDDFGTGFSSIENLIKMSVDTLKTDKILVDDLVENKSRRYLMKTLIDATHSFGMRIVVEGVESKEQAKILREFGADYIQGYYYSRPLTFEQLKTEIHRFAE